MASYWQIIQQGYWSCACPLHDSSTLTFSNSEDASPMTPRCPREEQSQEESDLLTQQTLSGPMSVPGGLKL